MRTSLRLDSNAIRLNQTVHSSTLHRQKKSGSPGEGIFISPKRVNTISPDGVSATRPRGSNASGFSITFQMWFNTLRIEKSKNILTSENISIEEVGIKVGIPESYNFSRWLKVVTGTIPLRYRKEANQSKTN